MAQITKEQLLAISEEFEKVYQDMVDELLINIAKHFRDPNNQRTMFWEVQKLSELGALTEESRDIIAKRANVIPELVEQKFWEVAKEANKDINPQLKELLKKGILPGTFKDIESSPAITRLLEEYIRQADNTMNLVNTTMLQSTLQAYSQVVQDITFYENQMQNAQSILNIASGMMTTNQATRQSAFKWALDKMADEGITGFTDRLGRHWNAESYVAMVIRTTAHNVAINSVKERMNEYGSDIFQVSAHSGCRPSHYKFQNKFYSWSSPAGTFEDGLGRKHKYENITDVSADDKYGSTYPSVGGIFGINCSHYPIPIIPGLSIPRERNVQSKEESDKEYALSQEQRALERRIRELKRNYEIDKTIQMSEDTLKKDRQLIQDAQKDMRLFTERYQRPRRYDREQISSGIARNDANEWMDAQARITRTERYKNAIAGQIFDADTYLSNELGYSEEKLSELRKHGRIDEEAYSKYVNGKVYSFEKSRELQEKYKNVTLADKELLEEISKVEIPKDSGLNGSIFQKFVYATGNGADKPKMVERFADDDIIVYRGVESENGVSGKAFIHGLKNDDIHFISRGVYGDGIYLSDIKRTAQGYSNYGDPSGAVVELAIDKKANFISFEKIEQAYKLSDEYQKGYDIDLSTYARLKGYDVITKDFIRENGDEVEETYYNVINRGVLKYEGN